MYRKEGDHEFMNIVSNEIADEVAKHCLLLHTQKKTKNCIFLETRQASLYHFGIDTIDFDYL